MSDRRKVRLFFCFLLFICAGCQKKADNNSTEAEMPVEVTEESEGEREVFAYTFQPHVIAEEYKKIYDSNIEDEFFVFCDAILNGRDSFPCSSRERVFQLLSISRTCLPIAEELIDKNKITVANGTAVITYKKSQEEVFKEIAEFKEKVTQVITSSIPYETSEVIKAIQLYTAVSQKDTYDEASTLSDMLSICPYRAIMEDTGICQEIAGEYIYYLLQVGIQAIPCSALSRDLSNAHEWAFVKLDGIFYHMDPTYQISYKDSLYFFGMDDIQREYYGDFPAGSYCYGESDVLKQEDYKVMDRRFEELWLAERYQINADNSLTIWEINTEEEKTVFFE